MSHSPVPRKIPMWLYFHGSGQCARIIGRVIEIRVLVVVAVEEPLDVERAAHRKQVAHPSGMPERDVRRVVAAEARAAHGHMVAVALAPGEVEHVVDDDVFVGVVGAQAVGGMDALVVPSFRGPRNPGNKPYPARVDEPADGLDQPELLVLVKASERGRKENQRQPAPVAEDQHLEIPAQMRRPPADVAFVHRLSLEWQCVPAPNMEATLRGDKRKCAGRWTIRPTSRIWCRSHERRGTHADRRHPASPGVCFAAAGQPARRAGVPAAGLCAVAAALSRAVLARRPERVRRGDLVRRAGMGRGRDGGTPHRWQGRWRRSSSWRWPTRARTASTNTRRRADVSISTARPAAARGWGRATDGSCGRN